MKKFNKGLKLNKKTVANLNNDDMMSLYGGGGTYIKCLNTVDVTNCQTDCICTATRTAC